jgi:hypothetical protein
MRIRMLEDALGSSDGAKVYRYVSGEVYDEETTAPRASAELMKAFVESDRAVEVDAQGNPLGTPASKRSVKGKPVADDAQE